MDLVLITYHFLSRFIVVKHVPQKQNIYKFKSSKQQLLTASQKNE